MVRGWQDLHPASPPRRKMVGWRAIHDRGLAILVGGLRQQSRSKNLDDSLLSPQQRWHTDRDDIPRRIYCRLDSLGPPTVDRPVLHGARLLGVRQELYEARSLP